MEVHSRIHFSKNVECPSICEWINTMVCPYNGILFSNKKKRAQIHAPT